MSLLTPSIAQIRDNIVAQVEGQLSATIPLLPVGFTRTIAAAWAASSVIIYKYAGAAHLNQFIQYANYEETTVNGRSIRPLKLWGDLFGVPPKADAVRSEHTVTVTVTTQTGTLPINSQLVNPTNGYIFQVLTAVPLSASTVTTSIRAVGDPYGNGGAGAGGNLVVGDKLQFISPLKNVAREVTVASIVTVGVDAETVESYRRRVLDRKQKPPQGGAHADYYHWALEVPGIVAAYPYNSDPGEITVYVEATEASSGSADGIPTASQLTAVRDRIRLPNGKATREPMGDRRLSVEAIHRIEFDVEITGLVAADLPTVKAKIEAAVDQYLRSREPYIVGLSVPPRADLVTQAGIAAVVLDVVTAASGSVQSVTLLFERYETTIKGLGFGERAKVGAVTYV